MLPSRLVRSLSGSGQVRNLFTDEFLSVTVFKEKQERALREMQQAGITKSQITEKLSRALDHPATSAGSHEEVAADSVILSKDVRNVILTSRTEPEITESGVLVKKYVEKCQPWNHPALLKKKSWVLRDYFCLCHANRFPDAATDLWSDQEFMDKVGFLQQDGGGGLAANMPSVALTYFDLLYKAERYDQMFAEMEKLEAKLADSSSESAVPFYVHLLYMMACLRMNTAESFAKATELYNRKPELMSNGKVANAYGLLILRHGADPALAYEVVTVSRKNSVLRTSLMVFILARLNRPEEACRLLESTLSVLEDSDSPILKGSSEKEQQLKLVFSVDCVGSLTKAA